MTTCDLHNKHCVPCEGGVPVLSAAEVQAHLAILPQWSLSPDNKTISKSFVFKGFAKTMAFANAVAWIAQQENHHPEVRFGYNYCEVSYTTHAINGLSDNDFICAAKVDKLFE